jgi:predicted nuclease of restriction endonuclease-like (RecB) superfamily
MSIPNIAERKFYEIECEKNSWSLRELCRQFDSALFERLALSRDKQEVKKLSEKGQLVEKPQDIFKEPYVLEFLGLDENQHYSESELESALISNLEKFLLSSEARGMKVLFHFRASDDNKRYFAYEACLVSLKGPGLALGY